MKVGEIASICHYSGKTWFKSVVLQVEKGFACGKACKRVCHFKFS